MRIEPGNRDARRRDARGLEIAIGNGDGSANALAGDRIGDVAQRNVRRHPRRPQGARDVELADEARDAELFLQVTKLVLLREAAEAHRVLVERREHDAVDFAALRGVGGRFERDQRRVAAGLRRLARRHGLVGDELERRERRTARLELERTRRAAKHVDPRLGDALACRQHGGIGVDDDIGCCERFRAREELHRDLGADAVGVAQQHGEPRPGGCGTLRVSRHGCSPS